MSDPLIIGGKTMPTLSLNGLTVSKEKIWSSNTGRTSSGTMVGDLIAIKYKLQCTWPPLTREQTALIDSAISKPFFDVEFTDPGSNSRIKRKFYAGTPKYPVYSYAKGIKTYTGVAVDLIEK